MKRKFFFLLLIAFSSFSISLVLGLIQNASTLKSFNFGQGEQKKADSGSNIQNNKNSNAGLSSENLKAKISKKAETYYLYSSAVLDIQNGKLDKAETSISKLLKLNPENLHFRLAAAQLYFQKGDSQKAQKETEYVIKQNESDYEAWRLLGMIYLDQFRKNEKQEYLAKVLNAFKNVYKFHPEDTDELTMRITSILMLDQGYIDDATVLLQKLLANYPSHPVAIQNLEKIYTDKKDQQSLFNLYKQITDETPEDLGTQFKLADIAFKLRKFDDAEKALIYLNEELSKTSGQDFNKDNLAIILKQLGYIYARKNRLNEALDSLLQSRKIKDDLFTSYYVILVLVQQKDYVTARKEMNIALKEYANLKDAFELKMLNCQLLQKENKNQDALKEIEKLISSDKSNIDFKTTKARLLMNINNFKEAKDYLKDLYKEYPSNTDVIFLLGTAHERLKEYNEAENYMRLCIKLEPGNSAVMNYLGYMWAEQGINLQDAENLIKKALDLDPTSSAFLDSLGWVYYKMGNYPKARYFLEKAVAEGVSGGEIYDHLGDLYYKINFLEEAIDSWKRCLSEDDINIDYEKIQSKIDAAEKKFKK